MILINTMHKEKEIPMGAESYPLIIILVAKELSPHKETHSNTP